MLAQVLLNVSEIIVIVCWIKDYQKTKHVNLYILWFDKRTSDTTLHKSHSVMFIVVETLLHNL